jgi:large subunit ribosomal protein L29
MKTKLKELRDRGTEELRKEIDEKRRHLFDLRSQAVTEKLEDPSQLRKTRKDIARVLTILREREGADQKKAKTKAKARA